MSQNDIQQSGDGSLFAVLANKSRGSCQVLCSNLKLCELPCQCHGFAVWILHEEIQNACNFIGVYTHG